MEKYKDEINWTEEVEKFIEKRLYQIKKEKILKQIDKSLESLPEGELGVIDK